MTYTVAITSQGQISIPAKIRRQLGLDKTMRAVVSSQGGKVIIEPLKDILELAGSFKADLKSTPKQIRKGFEEYLAKEAVGKTK